MTNGSPTGRPREGPVASVRCPICGRPFDVAETPAMPFCSDRCRQIDLGRWLREYYGVTVERDDWAESDEATDDDSG